MKISPSLPLDTAATHWRLIVCGLLSLSVLLNLSSLECTVSANGAAFFVIVTTGTTVILKLSKRIFGAVSHHLVLPFSAAYRRASIH